MKYSRYIFSDEEIKNIISLYREGNSSRIISQQYPCSSKTIERLLKKNNINAKDNPNNITILDWDANSQSEIIKLYEEGISTVKLAEKYNVGVFVIESFLKKKNVLKKRKIVFSEVQIQYIIEKYISGYSIIDISEEFNVNYETIKKQIPEEIYVKNKFSNISKRKFKEFTEDEKINIAELYRNGTSLKSIAHKYSSSIQIVQRILTELNLTGKDNPNWDKYKINLSKDEEEKIIQEYLDGISQHLLAIKFGYTRHIINNVLSKYGYSSINNPKSSYNNSKQVDENMYNQICSMYEKGDSIKAIHTKLNIGYYIVKNILIKNGITIRKDMPCQYSDEYLLDVLKNIELKYGYINIQLFMSISDVPSIITYRNRFQSFQMACQIAGISYLENKRAFSIPNECCRSGYEYRMSLFLQKYGIKYERDVLYSDVFNEYLGRSNIDYKIIYKDKIILCEIFGMMGSSFNDYAYDKRMQSKKQMFKNNDIELLELYPLDFKYSNDMFESNMIKRLDSMIGV